MGSKLPLDHKNNQKKKNIKQKKLKGKRFVAATKRWEIY